MEIGARIAAWRAAKGMTRQAFAKAVGVTVAAVYQWEGEGKSANHHTTPTLESLDKIVDALGLTIVQFYGRIPTAKKAKAS